LTGVAFRYFCTTSYINTKAQAMTHFSRDPFLSSPALLSVRAPRPWFGRRIAATLGLWRERARMRRALAQVDARSLRDAGITPTQAMFEANQPFWRRPGSLR
jgi:uncharacterized protein YjiS (DUF1127 family)